MQLKESSASKDNSFSNYIFHPNSEGNLIIHDDDEISRRLCCCMCEYALQHVQLLSCINACSVECIGISSVLTCITVCVCVCVMRYHGNHLPSERSLWLLLQRKEEEWTWGGRRIGFTILALKLWHFDPLFCNYRHMTLFLQRERPQKSVH